MAAAISALLVVLMASTGLYVARTSALFYAERELAHDIADAAHIIGADLDNDCNALLELTRQPLVANALLDSEGRETYLRPFLERVRLAMGEAAILVLTDFKGQALATSRGATMVDAGLWLQAVIADGRPQVIASTQADRTYLLVAVPVIYAATDTAEGALVLQADLTTWLGSLHTRLASESRLASVALGLHDIRIPLELVPASGELIEASGAVTRHELLQPLDLRLMGSLPSATHRAPLDQLGDRYWLMGVLGVIGAVLASQGLAHVFATRIEGLARLAREPSLADAGEPAMARFARGNDEISDLARLIASQFARIARHRRMLEQRVAETTRDLHLAQKVAHTGSWTFDPTSGRFMLSPQCAAIIARPQERVVSWRALLRRIDPADRGRVLAAWRSCLDLGSCEVECRLSADGPATWVATRAECSAPQGRVVGIVQDISARKHADVEMRRALTVFNHCDQAIMVTDANSVILAVNPAFGRITGYTAAEACGRTPALLKSGRHRRDFYLAMRESLRTRGRWEGEIWNRRKSGEHYLQWLSITVVPARPGEAGDFVAIFSDVSERKRREEVSWRREHLDTLTGMAQLTRFCAHVDKALSAPREESNIALVCVDMHGLSALGNRVGHAAGDAFIVDAVRRLQAHVNDHDSLARRGSDQFLLMLDGRARQLPADALCDALAQDLDRPFVLGAIDERIPMRLGVALAPREGTTATELIDKAELAMRAATPSRGSSLRRYSSELEADRMERRELAQNLQEALSAKAFTLYYQPVFEIGSGALACVEALIRWPRGAEGIAPTRDFIDTAESAGLLPELALWSIREAVSQAGRWRSAATGSPRLSLNMHGVDLDDRSPLPALREALAASRLDAGAVTLEIPEAVLRRTDRGPARFIAAAQEMGLQVAVDDFGEELASLVHLQRYGIGEVKISRRIVTECTTSAAAGRTLAAIVAMARDLGVRSTAKGVENAAQLEFLRRAGCERMQGHLLSPPLPADALALRMREWGVPAAGTVSG